MKSIFKKFYDIFLFLSLGSVDYARKKGVIIGKDCRIFIKNWGSEPFLITIGDNVTVTSGVKFITHDGSTCLIYNEYGERYQKFLPIKVGSNVFIGVNSIIMPGVKIGSNVVIGAGSVVIKDIPDNSIAVGVPAKVVSNFDSYQEKIRNTCASNSELNGISDYKTRVYHAMELQKSKKSFDL